MTTMKTVEGIGALVVPVDGPVRHVVLVARNRGSYVEALREHTGAEYLATLGHRRPVRRRGGGC